MKLKNSVLAASLIGFASASGAVVLPKNILTVKQDFDKAGATACSQAISETLNFLAKGRDFANNKQWSTENTNSKPISIDFLISGTDSDYSMSGSIVLTPVGKQCFGMYVYSYVAPSPDCMTYIQKNGFDGADWQQTVTDRNGDGGKLYFLSLKKNSGLNFIFNDVAGGCAMTKRETLFLEAK